MSETKLDCPSSVDLTEAEVAWLDALPDAGDSAPRTAWCELDDQHAGRHVASAQDTGTGPDDPGTSYWVWWQDNSAHEVGIADPCEEKSFDDPQEPQGLLCLLPSGHVGKHRF